MNIILFVYFTMFSIALSAILEFNLTPMKQPKSESEYSNIMIDDLNDPKTRELLWETITRIQSNELFTIEATFGTPPQEFNVLVDTGSFLNWVAKEGSKDLYEIPHHFKPQDSSTYSPLQTTFTLKYVTGQCSGLLSRDVLGIYDQSLKIDWGLASNTASNFGCDGIFGFGRRFSSPVYSNTQNLIYRFKEDKIIDKAIFSFKIDPTNIENSKMFVGDYHDDFNNEKNKEHIGFCNLRESEHWACRMSYIVIGDSSIENIKQNAVSFYYQTIFDSGSNRILLPDKAFKTFEKVFSKTDCKAAIDIASLSKFIICSSVPNLPDFSFVFNGYSIRLLPSVMFSKIEDQYFFNIIFWNQPLYIIGMPFFHSAHMLFDNETSQVKFYVEDLKNFKNVTQFSTDDDFLLSEHPGAILGIVVGCLAVLGCIGAVYLYYRKKKQNSLITTLLPR